IMTKMAMFGKQIIGKDWRKLQMEKDYKKRMVELTNALDDFCYGLRELGFGEVAVPQDIIDLMASAYRAAKSDEFISKENYLSMINKVQELEKAEEQIDK